MPFISDVTDVYKRQGPGGTIRIASSPLEKPGDRIGRYKLLERVGEGGCGVVYVAEQTEPVRRRVALKAVSYTHLDVYKRQPWGSAAFA